MKFFQCFKPKKERPPQPLQEQQQPPQGIPIHQLFVLERDTLQRMETLERLSAAAMKRADIYIDKGNLQKAVFELSKKRTYREEHLRLYFHLTHLRARITATELLIVKNPLHLI